MERKDLVWIILVSVIIAVLISFIIPVFYYVPKTGTGGDPMVAQQVPPPPDQQPREQTADGQGPPRPPQYNEPPGMQQRIHLKTLISFINIGLIIPLFIIYAGIYRKIRSSFTFGLIAVIFALGMYAITSNPMLISLFGGRAEYIGFFQIVPDLCATIALIILIRISVE